MYAVGAHTVRTKRKPTRELTPTEAAEIKQAFDLFDTDRSGKIYYRELKVSARWERQSASQWHFLHEYDPSSKPTCRLVSALLDSLQKNMTFWNS
jgi:hypothetical protein